LSVFYTQYSENKTVFLQTEIKTVVNVKEKQADNQLHFDCDIHIILCEYLLLLPQPHYQRCYHRPFAYPQQSSRTNGYTQRYRIDFDFDIVFFPDTSGRFMLCRLGNISSISGNYPSALQG
jgi:hypothetical protein